MDVISAEEIEKRVYDITREGGLGILQAGYLVRQWKKRQSHNLQKDSVIFVLL